MGGFLRWTAKTGRPGLGDIRAGSTCSARNDALSEPCRGHHGILQVPLMHLPAQGTPHSPQFASSTFTFVQTGSPPPAGAHFSKPPGQPHSPSEQTSPLSHLIPQPPQFAGLLVVFVHTAGSPHSSVFSGQEQAPASQVRPPVQAMPHPPQLLMSVSVMTHAAAHSVSPLAQS